MRRARLAPAVALGLALGLSVDPRPAAAQSDAAYGAHAALSPSRVSLGQATLYRGWVIVPHGARARWLPPATGGSLSWGTPQAKRSPQHEGTISRNVTADTLSVQIPLQAFATGDLSVPGLSFEVDEGGTPARYPLPTLRLQVAADPAAADSSAELHALRGPLAAPWWERVPWRWVVLGGLLLALVAWIVLRLRKRKPKPMPVAAPVARVAKDPSTEALSELAALRRLQLPEHGRYAEHAFHLTKIVRRYLEARSAMLRPGYTTGELIAHAHETTLAADAVPTLEGLLRLWDRLKFARAASSLEEARRAESEAEALIRRPPADAPRRVA